MRPRRFQFLLVILALASFITPLIGKDLIARSISAVISSLAFVQVCVATIPRRRILFSLSFLAVILSVFGSLVISVDSPPFNHNLCQIIARIVAILFYGFGTVLIFRDVIREGEVDLNKLCGAVCLYLLIGILFGQLYQLCDVFDPGSMMIESSKFQMHGEINAFERSNICNYFSFVTLTTLGYGDVQPLSRATRTLAYTEALLGQIYLAILVSRLVGLHIAASAPSPNQDE